MTATSPPPPLDLHALEKERLLHILESCFPTPLTDAQRQDLLNVYSIEQEGLGVGMFLEAIYDWPMTDATRQKLIEACDTLARVQLQ